MKKVTSFDNTKLSYYCDIKKGKPCLLFIHGAWTNHTSFVPFFKYFKNFSIIAPDLRCHGHSSIGLPSIKNHAKDILTILKKENIKKAIVIGNSLGTSIALELTKTKPQLVKDLVLFALITKPYIRFYPLLRSFSFITRVCTSFFRSRRKLVPLDFTKHWNVSVLKLLFLQLKGVHTCDFFSIMDELFSYSGKIKDISPKTLLVQGNSDHFVYHKKIKKAAKNKKNITFIELDTHHVLMSTKLEECIKVTKTFINKETKKKTKR